MTTRARPMLGSIASCLLTLATACSGPNQPSTHPRASPSPERANATVVALREIGTTDDLGMKARIAASAFSEPVYGLSSTTQKGLSALSNESLDGPQRSRIIGAMFDDDAELKKAFDAVCKPSYEALRLKGMDERKRLELLMESCGRRGDPTATTTLSMAFALAVALESEMKMQGAPGADLDLTRLLVHLP